MNPGSENQQPSHHCMTRAPTSQRKVLGTSWAAVVFLELDPDPRPASTGLGNSVSLACCLHPSDPPSVLPALPFQFLIQSLGLSGHC